ncbi:MAG: hypothetical protein AAF266_07335 [Planctomycetota bacterium]
MRYALLLVASTAVSAFAAEPLTDAVVYATDDPRVFELRLPESVVAPEEPPEEPDPVQLTTYICPESGNCHSGCSVCNRRFYERWAASVDYLLLDVSNAYSIHTYDNTKNATANGVRVQLEQEIDEGLGWRVRYEWFGDEASDIYGHSYYGYDNPHVSAHRLGLDLFQRFKVGRTDFRLGIGPAAARIDRSDVLGYYSVAEQDYEGYGVGGFVDFRTRIGQIGRTEFALVGGLGQDYLTAGQGNGIHIRQLQFGIESKREFKHGSLILRTAYENQYWSHLYDVQGASFRLGYTW